MAEDDRDAWFAPKMFGIGAGLPIRWQGWALVSAYLLVLGGSLALIHTSDEVWEPVGHVIVILATVALLLVAKARTRGGWRWRWGSRD